MSAFSKSSRVASYITTESAMDDEDEDRSNVLGSPRGELSRLRLDLSALDRWLGSAAFVDAKGDFELVATSFHRKEDSLLKVAWFDVRAGSNGRPSKCVTLNLGSLQASSLSKNGAYLFVFINRRSLYRLDLEKLRLSDSTPKLEDVLVADYMMLCCSKPEVIRYELETLQANNDGSRCVFRTGLWIYRWDKVAGLSWFPLDGLTRKHKVAFSNDGQFLLAVVITEYQGKLQLRRMYDGKELCEFWPPFPLEYGDSISLTNSHVWVCTGNRSPEMAGLYIYRLRKGKDDGSFVVEEKPTRLAHPTVPAHTTVSNDNSFYLARQSGSIEVIDVDTPDTMLRISNVGSTEMHCPVGSRSILCNTAPSNWLEPSPVDVIRFLSPRHYKFIAFACGLHPRLGKKSGVVSLNADVMIQVKLCLLGW